MSSRFLQQGPQQVSSEEAPASTVGIEGCYGDWKSFWKVEKFGLGWNKLSGHAGLNYIKGDLGRTYEMRGAYEIFRGCDHY